MVIGKWRSLTPNAISTNKFPIEEKKRKHQQKIPVINAT